MEVIKLCFAYISFFICLQTVLGNSCIPKKYNHDSIVCVCNATYCDTYNSVKSIAEGKYVKYESTCAGLRLERAEGKFIKATASFFAVEILIEHSIQYQRIFGFGTHFTDTSGSLLNQLSVDARRRLVTSYWSAQGSEYSMARVPMGATDFGQRYYTYMDKYEEGMQLTGFKLADEDHKLKIPHMLTALNISHHPIRFIASPWSAPPWMKTSKTFPGGELLPEYYQAYADYYVKFLDAYKKEGINVWALTTGNEPLNGYVPSSLMSMPTMSWNPITAAKWMKQNFGPTIRKSKYKDTKILIHDDTRMSLPAIQVFCMDKEAMKYPNGVATHFYSDAYTPEIMMNLAKCPNRDDLFLLMTEATEGFFLPESVSFGSWQRGQNYMDSIIMYMNYDFSGWIDWNQCLDTKGGPVMTGYTVDSCIIVNVTADEFYKQPTFYSMAHFSKFVPPGSVRIDSKLNAKLLFFPKVTQVAFRRPDGGTVVVIHNKEETYVDVDIKDETRGQIKISLKPKSFTTVLYW